MCAAHRATLRCPDQLPYSTSTVIMTTRIEPVHESEIAMLEMHEKLERELGKPPSLRRLAAALGYSDHSGVDQCLRRCKRHGLIKIVPATREITAKGRLAMSRGIKACLEGENTRLKSRPKSR